MPALDVGEATRLIEATMGLTAYPAPTTPMMMDLTTDVGTRTSPGTVVVGGGYAPQEIAVNAVGVDGATENSTTIDYPNMPDTTANDVQGVEISDSTGRRALFGALTTARTTLDGDTLSFAPGAVTLTYT